MRLANTPFPTSSRPWGRGSSRQFGEKVPGGNGVEVMGERGEVVAEGMRSGERRVEW